MNTVMIVDDNRELRFAVSRLLEARGLQVLEAEDGATALRLLATHTPTVLVVDVIMPGISGLDLVRRIRASGNDVPILLLTEFGGASDRAVAIEQGADDYLNKPFDPAELIARIVALGRRGRSGGVRRIQVGQLEFDLSRYLIVFQGRDLPLTPKAGRLLLLFMQHPNQVMTRRRLLDDVWGYGMPVESRALDQRISEIRKTLRNSEVVRPVIVTVQDIGYRLDSEA